MFTDPVVGINFVDRSHFLNILAKRAHALEEGYRQNIALLGPEAIGKTSLIFQFLSKLQESSKSILPIYLEITNSIPFDHLAKRFVALTIFNFLKMRGVTSPENLDILLENARDLIPETTEEAKKCLSYLKNSSIDNAYSTMLDLPQALSQETKTPVIVILEEFHKLNRLSLNNPFGILAKKIMVSKNVMHIISSSSVSHASKILSHDLTLLFGNFETLTLEPFDIKTSESFIEKKVAPVKCSSYYKQFIIEITNGQPLYLNIVASEIKSIAMERKLSFVNDAVIIESISGVLFNSEGILNQIFNYRMNQLPTNRSPISYTSILLALGHNCLKSKQIKEYLNTGSEKEFLNHLNALLELDYIHKNGVFYYLYDELFRIWVTDVYENKKSSLEIETNIMGERFRRLMRDRLNSFLKNKQRSALERLKNLFLTFGNETVYLNSRRISLPTFNNIEIRNQQTSTPLIICGTKSRPWLFAVRKDHICDTAMEEIISNCRKLKHKYTRKIVIALDGIDENARLMAKEEKFITLELSDLNNIFRLFGKNKIFSE